MRDREREKRISEEERDGERKRDVGRKRFVPQTKRCNTFATNFYLERGVGCTSVCHRPQCHTILNHAGTDGEFLSCNILYTK